MERELAMAPLELPLEAISLIAPTCCGVRGVRPLTAMMVLVCFLSPVASGGRLFVGLPGRARHQIVRMRQIWAAEAGFSISDVIECGLELVDK